MIDCTHPGVICRGRRHSGLEYHTGRYYCTSGCLSTGFCLLNNAAIAVIHATNSIGIINKPFVESAGFLEALESVIIPQLERFRPQLLIISGTSQHMHPSIDSFFHSTISSIHPSTHPSHLIYSSIQPSIHSFIHPSIHSFINPSFHSFIHLSIHLFIHPPIYSTIYPPIFSSIYSSMVLICNMCMCMFPLQLGSTVTPPILWVNSCATRW